MVIGKGFEQIREHKNLPQGDIEKRTGHLRCCLSRWRERPHCLVAQSPREMDSGARRFNGRPVLGKRIGAQGSGSSRDKNHEVGSGWRGCSQSIVASPREGDSPRSNSVGRRRQQAGGTPNEIEVQLTG